jgi:lipopolysaccharide export system protein LptA
VLELSRTHGTLSAHGSGSAPAVYAVFTGSQTNPQTNPKPGSKTQAAPSVVRLQSRTLFYAENDHKAVFSGGVVAQTISGILHSSFMDVYFSPGPSPARMPDQQGSQKTPSVPSQNVPSQSGSSQSVSKIVARGAVQLEQPGRKGTGEELTYTAADGKFVLTGTSGAPPRLSDQVRGVVTGNALIFNDRDDSVVVSGGASNAVTQTRVAR